METSLPWSDWHWTAKSHALTDRMAGLALDQQDSVIQHEVII